MTDQEPSDRFDYLFAPIDGETTTTDEPAFAPDAAPPRPRRSWALPVLAVLVGLLGIAAAVLSWPEPVDAVPAPTVTTTPVPPPPSASSATAVPPEPAPPPEATPGVPPEPVQLAPEPAAPPPSTREDRQAPTPISRAPMSVSPIPRPAFPNQIPHDGDPGRGGGLLPGLGPL